MASGSAAPTLGRRFVFVVLLGAVLPLGAIGLWVTLGAARSGRTLLRSQLEVQLARTTGDVEQRWRQLRSDLLTLGENEPVRLVLLDSTGTQTNVPDFVHRTFARMDAFERVTIRDRDGHPRIELRTPEEGIVTERADSARVVRGLGVRLPLTDLASGDTIGSIDASLRVAMLLPEATQIAQPAGPLIAVFGRGRGVAVPVGADPRLFADEGTEWGGHNWLTVRRSLSDPPVDLAIAGALDAYLDPFERTARRSAGVLLVAAVIVVLAVGLVTRRMTSRVERELAQREALAAVGEFSSELAHEVRNPLTAIRLDLQRAEESADDPDAVRGIIARALHQIDRLDRAVSGALRVSRGGSIEPHRVDLRDVLDSARRSAEHEFTRRGATVRFEMNGQALPVDGDAGALEQLFLNLLINAAQSLSSDGEARVAASRRNGDIEIRIEDTGVGMSAARLRDVEQPFRSTRRDGTGLGLKIARRIVASHHGELQMTSNEGVGTTVRVRLPAG